MTSMKTLKLTSTLAVLTLAVAPALVMAQANTYPWPASGNVGIGAANPIGTLYVGNNAGATISIGTNGLNGSSTAPLYPTIDFLGYSNGNKARIRAIEQTWNTYASGLSFLVNDGSGPTNLVERLTVLGNGNVGIGTTVPNESKRVIGPMGDNLAAA